ncbi:MAG: hypothetical protein C5B50_01050 [Verrucomicrobia bacterium]|nr:MAG: hypothetical protein C5B50_01050 [Verrucomicrobiota bacterium]
MQKNQLSPACLQPFLESASNSVQKGMAQYFTPVEWAEILSSPLPRLRYSVVDFNCGNGQLLKGSARPSTSHLLGCDIDPSALCNLQSAIPGDLTRLYPLLCAVQFKADCFALNPPWDLHWYRERLSALADSELPSVRQAFAAHDGRTSPETIDSTIATLCIALDLCSTWGEGFLIANEATLQRLILQANAPHSALAAHIWAHIVVEGNICLPGSAGILPASNTIAQTHGPSDLTPDTGSPDTFRTGIIYFARNHDSGFAKTTGCSTLEAAKFACESLYNRRSELRQGPEIKVYAKTDDTAELWKAVGQEWERLSRKDRPQWNLSLTSAGLIHADLTPFDAHSGRINKTLADTLFRLHDKQPMQLVLQRHSRRALERAVAPNSPWRIGPALVSAVHRAIEEYQRVRAPLYPLSPIQRLGYLDECDDIVCSRNLRGRNNTLDFTADQKYPLRSTTIGVKRSGKKLNLEGQYDDVEWNGQELAFFITDNVGTERIFMDARLQSPDVEFNLPRSPDNPKERVKVDFTLQDLVHHFIVPNVEDVARTQPDTYQSNLKLLTEIESLCAL